MKTAATALLPFAVLLAATGCSAVDFGVERIRLARPETRAAEIKVAIFDHRTDVEAGVPSARSVHSRLWRVEPRSNVNVFHSHESSWTLEEVRPGDYVFEVSGWTGPRGDVVLHRPVERSFRVGSGERVVLKTVLHDGATDAAQTIDEAARIAIGVVRVTFVGPAHEPVHPPHFPGF